MRVTVRRRPEADAAPAAAPCARGRRGALLEPATRAAGTNGFVRVEARWSAPSTARPQPGAPPFVEEGDAVAAGQTLCILEAMKLMNEVKAEVEGVVREIHVENAQPVEFGQLLFELEPLGRPLDASDVHPRPRREPRRDRGARDPRAARARRRGGRGLLDRRRATRCTCGSPTTRSASARRPPPRATCASRSSSPPRRRPAARPCTPATASSPRTRRSSSACDDNDLVFVGPTRRGDGADGRQGAREGTSCARPASRSCPAPRARRRSTRRARAAGELGYPVLLKATAGGGGKGMRLVADAGRARGRVRDAPPARREAAFGDGEPLRREGGRAGAPRRDPGALRRARRRAHARRARVLDPAPPPEADRGVAVARARRPSTREEMEAAAERACRAIGYRNAGTFEFLLGPDGSFYFIELNARLQVEHPVTELVTGIDIVREQLRIAAGRAARDRPGARRARGHAIEIRLNAEDPARDFLPAPGPHRALPAAARAGRPRRHVRRGRHGRPAVLRLADREGDRLGRRPARCDRARAPRARRARGARACRRRASARSTSSAARSSQRGDYSTSFLEEAGARLPALNA